MEDQPVIHNTFVIERSFAATPERVFAAFADPAKKRRWLLDGGGREAEHYEMDFRVGGREQARFRITEGPVKGCVCTNDTNYMEIVPNRRVVFAYTMTMDEHCFSATLVTVELHPSAAGTDLVLTHQGAFFEGADGAEMREKGWRSLLDRVEAQLAQ